MTCPFLKETRMKYCQSAAIRKMIPLAQSNRSDEKCSSGDYASCAVFQAQPHHRLNLAGLGAEQCGAQPPHERVDGFSHRFGGKVKPAQTRHGGLNPISALFVKGAVPKNGFT